MDDGSQAAATTEATPTATPEAATQSATEQAATQENGVDKPDGFNPVDFTPEQQARIDRLYGNMKRYEKESKEQKQANEILISRFQELANNQQQIVTHLQSTDYQETENTLRTQQRTAWDKGDLDGYHAATEKLIEVKAQKAINARQSNQQKPNENNQQPLKNGHDRAISATEALEMSVASGETPAEQAPILRAYFGEADENGNLRRPWVNVSDVRNTQAARVAAVVFDPEHPTFGAWNLKQKLAEVDRQMGVQSRQQQGQNVLGAGNLTRTNQKSNVKLTPQEETIAVRTKFAGSKAKSDDDHKTAYLQAKIKHSSSGNRSRA